MWPPYDRLDPWQCSSVGVAVRNCVCKVLRLCAHARCNSMAAETHAAQAVVSWGPQPRSSVVMGSNHHSLCHGAVAGGWGWRAEGTWGTNLTTCSALCEHNQVKHCTLYLLLPHSPAMGGASKLCTERSFSLARARGQAGAAPLDRRGCNCGSGANGGQNTQKYRHRLNPPSDGGSALGPAFGNHS